MSATVIKSEGLIYAGQPCIVQISADSCWLGGNVSRVWPCGHHSDRQKSIVHSHFVKWVRNLSSKYYLHPIKCGCCSGILITGRANSQKTIAEWGNSLICSVRVSISLHPFLSSTQLCCANQHSQLRLEVWPQQKLRLSQWRYLQWRKKLSGIRINS